MSAEVFVIICCDTDPDMPEHGRYEGPCKNIKLTWSGVVKGIPKLKEITSLFGDNYGSNPKITWLLRSDTQMKIIYGDYSWSIKNFNDIWKDLLQQGDEIGWHPHLWRWNEENRIWYQETKDQKWIQKCLQNGYKSIPQKFKPKSMRSGWHYQSDLTMKILNNLGILADLSALSGMKGIRYFDKSKIAPYNVYNWKHAPNHPYFPSKNNYQKPSKSNSESLNILEVPVTTFSFLPDNYIARFLKGFIPYKPGEGFRKPKFQPYVKSALEITGNPQYFQIGVRKVFMDAKTGGSIKILNTFFHPDELLSEKGKYSISNFEKNLVYVKEVSDKFDIPFRFIGALDTRKIYLRFED